jgi:cellulose synthase/poly-beta-1,6-N-acetylglucosamine synthase-like glycosyltransferase
VQTGGVILRVQVSVIATVRNESGSIERLLESLSRQTRQPDEVIIVDGGSTDDTLTKLQAWQSSGRLPLRVLVEPGANISQGRNAAIAAARGTVIVSTDAGVGLEREWLSHLVQPFETEGEADTPAIVACGFFVPDTRTVFEVALGATTLPALQDINPQRFLPSSRSVAFLRSAWEAISGYPEWLDYCEDLILDLRLQRHGYRFVFVPEAVAHFRPRRSLHAFSQQYYRYARGDGKADLWRWKHAVRYLTYLVALPVFLWLSLAQGVWWAVLLALGAAAMFFTPFRRLLPVLPSLGTLDRLKALLWVPVIRVTGDIAKMLGYPVGLVWRWRHRSDIPNWRQ